MPQLASGRHFALVPSTLIDRLDEGDDPQRYALIVAIRLGLHKPEDLLQSLPIAYFGANGPPIDKPFLSPYTVSQVLASEADWRPEEIEEFQRWLATDRVRDWVTQQFDALMAAIPNNSLWDSAFMRED